MSVTRDATSLVYCPSTAAEVAELFANTGLPAPVAGWGFQELSTPHVDFIAGGSTPGNLTGSAVTFGQAVTGWSRKASEENPEGGSRGQGPSANTIGGSATVLMLSRLISTPSSNRVMAYMSGATLLADSSGHVGVGDATITPNFGSQAMGTTVHPIVFVADWSSTKAIAYTDQETVTLTGTFTTTTNNLFLGDSGGFGIGGAARDTLFGLFWLSALTAAQAAIVINRILNGPQSYVPPVFENPRARPPRRQDYNMLVPQQAAAVAPTGIAALLVKYSDRLDRMRSNAIRGQFEAHNLVPITNTGTVPTQPLTSYADFAPRAKPTHLRGLDGERQNVSPLGSTIVPLLSGAVELPDVIPRRTVAPHRMQSLALGPLPQGSPPPTPGRGPNGTTLVMLVEDGAQVTWSWATDVLPARDGIEHRIQTTDTPRVTFQFSANLKDPQAQSLQSMMIRRAAKAQVFLVGDMTEASTITIASVASTTINVNTTTMMDWAYAGSRIAVFNTTTEVGQTAVIQSFSANQIIVDVPVTCAAGDIVMPLASCYLDAAQKFGEYSVNATRYDLVARSFLFGNAAGAWPAVGASLTTFTDGLPIFTGGNEANALVGRAFQTGAEWVDLGGAIQQYGPYLVSHLARELRYTIRTDVDRQWLKLFLGTVVGRQKAFYLPSWRADFNIIAASTNTCQYSSTTDYAGQYSLSGAHNQVMIITTTGTILYKSIVASTDNGDGTQTMQFDSNVVGTISTISFLERCRLDQDDVVVVWEKAIGHTTLQAIVTKQ